MVNVGELQHRRAVRICGATFGLASNERSIITDPRYFEDMVLQSLLTDLWKVEEVPYDGVDAEFWVRNDLGQPLSVNVEPGGRRIVVTGDVLAAEKRCSDNRYSLFGNLGLFFRYTVSVLEHRGVFSFHASAIYKPEENRLVLLVGSAGAGKTVFVLSAIEKGWRILTVEMAHCEFRGDDLIIHKGALYDNIRVGNLTIDFPGAIEPLKAVIPETDDVWGHKFAVDFNPMAVEGDYLVNPRVMVVFPKVEMGRGAPQTKLVKPGGGLRRGLFGNLTEKIGSTLLLYDELPVPGMDTIEDGVRRMEFVDRLSRKVEEARSVLTGPRLCMEDI